jgi:hypothetical protein
MGIWTCTACGKKGQWGNGWARYSSIALDEACLRDVPVACSDTCWSIIIQKIRSNEWQLPVLLPEPGGFRVIKEKRGY